MSSSQQTDAHQTGTDYRIAHSVLESIVRHVVDADRRVQLHQGPRLGRGKALDVSVEEGVCRVTLGLDAHLGEHLPDVAAEVQRNVVDTLRAITGLAVESVDVTIVSVVPARESS